jgi:chromosome segregation ATPase
MKHKENDPVAAARRSLEGAQAALAAHDAAKADLERQLAEATDSLDGAEDSQARARLRRLVVEVREDLASYNRKRPKLVAAVKEAEAALRKMQQDAAQAQIAAISGRLDAHGKRITSLLEQVADEIAGHAALTIEMREIARGHDLPGPPAHRWLLPQSLIRSSAGAALRDALDRMRATGLPGAPAQARP